MSPETTDVVGAVGAVGAIAAFREKLAAKNPKSDSTATTPLWYLLHLYNKAEKQCYINYMEGAEILVNWLSPIDFQWERYPLALSPSFQVPAFLWSYSLSELCRLLHPISGGKDISQIAKLIILTSIAPLAPALAGKE